MDNKTLIAYATKNGSSKEIAKYITQVLEGEFKLEVSMHNLKMDTEPDISPYNNVVVGSDITMGNWSKKALEFFYLNDFRTKNVAVFVSSRRKIEKNKYREVHDEYITKTLQNYPLVKPITSEVFGSSVKKWNIKGIIRRLKGTELDNRNWDKITIWAKKIGKAFINKSD